MGAEQNQLQRHLAASGLRIARGSIVDAVLAKAGIINAPSSTKNADKAAPITAQRQALLAERLREI
jgi:hypothetical protein